MRKIHRLSPQIIAKIAAGEVIERPAYAVKELIENALDAKASIIEIQIEESGLKRITVSDNGEGMSKDDLEICFLPHTTSKVKNPEDLFTIASLGFRGEALASIAGISHMTIITRTAKDIGGRIIQIRGGIVEDSAPIGSPIGTIVTAEGLFYSVPLRKKFLKSAATEFRHITETVLTYALMHPQVHFVLKHNKKTVLEFPHKPTSDERLITLMGASLMDDMLPLSKSEGHIGITGMIAKPQAALKQQQKQYLFINKRRVTDKALALSVREAFGTLLPASYTPVFYLSLELPPETVDVNIHPRKEQVALSNRKAVFDAVKQAVTDTLKEHNITFHLSKFKQETSAKLGDTTSSAGLHLKSAVLPWDRKTNITTHKKQILTQLAKRYIIVEQEDAVHLVDQHAAHERILYNAFQDSLKANKDNSVALIKPIRISLSLPEKQQLKETEALFEQSGFLFQFHSDTEVQITHIPKVIQGRSMEKIVKVTLADMLETEEIDILKSSQRMIAFLACRAAIKAEESLSTDEMHELILKLAETENNETCPHGRPTTIQVSLKELDSAFGR